jgi:steroid 5-alpha reductase family enzyme
MSPLIMMLLGWLVVTAIMAGLWLVQRARRDAGVVDVGWAANLGLLAVLYAALGRGAAPHRVLVAVAAGVWSLRLAAYVYVNRVRGKEEDGRYQTLRARWGAGAQWRFLVFFEVQGLLDAILSLPFLVIASNRAAGLNTWEYAGAALWLVAIGGEALADRQLARFRADPANRGRTCRVGLWRTSRHPNYFFEWLHWWAYVLMALTAAWWWVTLVGPAIMTFFLFKVTGIPATEAQALASRGDDYRDYQRTTSMFVPWFPRKGAPGSERTGLGSDT